jgi:DNA invertase Pin-like site-specific DNA recombinase
MRDLGVSAFRSRNATHGALARFFEAIEAGRVRPSSVLIVESLDRLNRAEVLTALRCETA